MKKLISLIVILSVAFVTLKDTKRKELIYDSLVFLKIAKPCYNPEKNFIEVFEQEGFDYKQTDEKIIQTSLNKLASEDLIFSIPKISHHIYFTQDKNSKPLLNFYINKIEENFNKLNQTHNSWQHFLWTNHPDIFPEHIKNMPGVIVKNLNEIKDHTLYEYLLEAIKNGNNNKAYFMEASDILRLIVLQKFGGIYTDIDYEIYNAKALFELMHKFDFIGGREFDKEYSYYGNAFIATKPDHPVINEALSRMEQFSLKEINLPKYLKYPCNFYDKLYFNSPPLLTFAYFSKNNINGNNDVILPGWMLFNVGFARFKNGGCDYKKIEQEGFTVNNRSLTMLIADYTKAHSSNNFSSYDIIGADMFCASWVDKKAKRKYYWSFNAN